MYSDQNAMPRWVWVTLWLAVAFGIYSLIAYYSQPMHNQLLYGADSLFVPALYKYLFHDHYALSQVRGSVMSFLVPDFALYCIARWCSANVMEAMTLFAVLQTALYAWAVSRFKTFSEQPQSPLLLFSVFVSLALVCFGYLGNELLPTVVAGYHIGLFILVLLSLWCCCAYLLQPKRWHLVALVLLMVAAISSDMIYFTSFIGPIFAVLFLLSCIEAIDPQRLKTLSATLAVGLLLAMVAFYSLPMQIDRKFFNHRGVALVGPLLIFAGVYARQITKPFRWGKRGIVTAIVSIVVLFIAGLVYSSFLKTPFYAHTKLYFTNYMHVLSSFIQRQTPIAVVYAAVMIYSLGYLIRIYRMPASARRLLSAQQQTFLVIVYFAVASLVITSMTSILFDFDYQGLFSDQLRHLQVMLLVPLFIVLPLIICRHATLYRVVANRWFLVASTIVITLWVYMHTPPFNTSNRLSYYPSFVKCLDDHKQSGHLKAGMVSYWYSKPIYLLSKQRVQTVAIMNNPTPSPGKAILTEFWLNALPPYHAWDFNFILLGEDITYQAKLVAQFGKPQQKISCNANNKIWVYADGVLNKKLQSLL